MHDSYQPTNSASESDEDEETETEDEPETEDEANGTGSVRAGRCSTAPKPRPPQECAPPSFAKLTTRPAAGCAVEIVVGLAPAAVSKARV